MWASTSFFSILNAWKATANSPHSLSVTRGEWHRIEEVALLLETPFEELQLMVPSLCIARRKEDLLPLDMKEQLQVQYPQSLHLAISWSSAVEPTMNRWEDVEAKAS